MSVYLVICSIGGCFCSCSFLLNLQVFSCWWKMILQFLLLTIYSLFFLQPIKPIQMCWKKTISSLHPDVTWWVLAYEKSAWFNTNPHCILLSKLPSPHREIRINKHQTVFFWNSMIFFCCCVFCRRLIKRLQDWSACSPWHISAASQQPLRKRSRWELNCRLSSPARSNRYNWHPISTEMNVDVIV